MVWRAQVGQEGVQEAKDRGQIRGQAAGAQQRYEYTVCPRHLAVFVKRVRNVKMDECSLT